MIYRFRNEDTAPCTLHYAYNSWIKKTMAMAITMAMAMAMDTFFLSFYKFALSFDHLSIRSFDPSFVRAFFSSLICPFFLFPPSFVF